MSICKLFLCTIISLISFNAQLVYAGNSKADSGKERIVLMPLRLSTELQKIQGAMETALIEGLQEKYEVFAGERVRQKATEIFKRETIKALDARKDCDETRCLQNVAAAFQSELIGIASITKVEDGYLLALSITNIFDEKSVYSKSSTCKDCSNFQIIVKLKELTGKKKTDDEEHYNWGIGLLGAAGPDGAGGVSAIWHIDYDLTDLVNIPLGIRIGGIDYTSSSALYGTYAGAEQYLQMADQTRFVALNFDYMWTDKFRAFIGLGVFNQHVSILGNYANYQLGISQNAYSEQRTGLYSDLGFQYYFSPIFNFELGFSNLPNTILENKFSLKPQAGFALKF